MSLSNALKKSDKKFTVAIVNYGVGNLYSVKRACQLNGLNSIVTYSANEIINADAVILPGVGAYPAAMEALRQLHLVDIIKKAVYSGKPFIGICLGMQLLLEKSFEFGEHKGLGIIKGSVIRFDKPIDDKENILKVPQVGWNSIYSEDTQKWKNTFLEEIEKGELMYFVHSYYAKLEDESISLARTKYGNIEFCSSFQYNNVFACQFHPERSAQQGLKIYRTLAENLSKTAEV